MTIYAVTHPMRSKPIGRLHSSLDTAHKAALRAARRLGHATVKHWRDGRRVETIFADGASVTYLKETTP